MKKPVKVLQWLPRIICIAAILFISMFSLDAFSPGTPFLKQIGGFFIHNIPSLILLGFLIIAWKNEYIGGISYIVLGIFISVLIFIMNNKRTGSDIGQGLLAASLFGIPFIIAGVLFLWSYYNREKSTTTD